MQERGTIEIHLKELLIKAGLSKNKFCQRAELQRSQLNGYINNTITRLDVDVLVEYVTRWTVPYQSCWNTSAESLC